MDSIDQEQITNFLKNKRWFQSKSKQIQSVEITDWFEVKQNKILILKIKFNDSTQENYFLPITNSSELNECIGDNSFLQEFFNLLVHKQRLESSNGNQLLIELTKDSKFTIQKNASSFKALGVEQSNTSIIIDKQFIVKFIRKITEGINPETEILEALNSKELDFIPRLEAKVHYKTNSEEILVASIQRFVDNQGDCWKYFCELITDLKNKDTIIKSAKQLAHKTAQMHIALSTIQENDFLKMEDFTDEDLIALQKQFAEELENSSNLLEKKKLKNQSKLLKKIKAADYFPILEELTKRNIRKTRIHGDYHLGQVLKTQDSFIIIDFEGEPLKSIEERRKKISPLKDVAGMLRSFDYAFHSHLKGLPKIESEEKNKHLELLGKTKNEFLYEYLSKVLGRNFVFEDIELNKKLIRMFETQKALYEVNYEVNNRPDWLDIPINGLSELLQAQSSDIKNR